MLGPLDSSFHFKLKHSSFKQHLFYINPASSPCGHSDLIKQILFWIHAVSCPCKVFYDPRIEPVALGQYLLGNCFSHQGPIRFRPRAMGSWLTSAICHGGRTWLLPFLLPTPPGELGTDSQKASVKSVAIPKAGRSNSSFSSFVFLSCRQRPLATTVLLIG